MVVHQHICRELRSITKKNHKPYLWKFLIIFYQKKSDQDANNTATNIQLIITLIIYKGFIGLLLTTLWDHIYGGARYYHFEYSIYLLSCIALELCIIIDRAVVSLFHGKDFVDGINTRYK